MAQTVWSHLDEIYCDKAAATLEDAKLKKGELVVVGAGIASLRQMTIETLDFIQRADKVFYTVLDDVTSAFIQQHAKQCEDLYRYYDNEKPREATYTQMAEIMLESVREGNLTVAVFYGHPGVFVTPTHRAIYIAREEGFSAKMIPGVSAEDCLYADLGIDPATAGCSMFEATHLIQEPNRLDPRNHVLIWQPGCVGVTNMIFDNEEIHKLADYMETVYGPEHPIIAYFAACQPFANAQIDKITVKDLRDPEKVKSIPITAGTTIYVPPKTLPAVPEEYKPHVDYELAPTSAHRIAHPDIKLADIYREDQQQWCADLKSFVPPTRYIAPSGSPSLRRLAIKLALLHHRLNALSIGKHSILELAASEPELTSGEIQCVCDNLRDFGVVLREGRSRPPQSVNGRLPPVLVTLNIIRKDATITATLESGRCLVTVA